jgi:multidrug resistance efflux pump
VNDPTETWRELLTHSIYDQLREAQAALAASQADLTRAEETAAVYRRELAEARAHVAARDIAIEQLKRQLARAGKDDQ